MTAPAIIGMACRFPGAPDLQAYWELLVAGRCAVGPAPAGRWPAENSQQTEMQTEAGYLEQIAAFDPAFFRLTRQEAQAMDPQQRLLMMLSWESLEDAGIAPECFKGENVGVFIGLSSADYAQQVLQGRDQVSMHTITGLAASVTANRLSYFWNWTGPSLIVDTACSASLTALHLACESLQRGECEYALVGAANLLISPLIQAGFAEAQALSPTGRCHAFGAQADGMVRSEGAGMVLLSRAAQPHQRVYASIRGSALGQDGQTQGLTAPSPAGQRRVLQRAYAQAQLRPQKIFYVEAHGTGTPLGDPIEARALADVVGQEREQDCWLGSVKSNLGHLEAAAGLAGVIKTALSLYHGLLPATLFADTANPRIPFGKNGLRLVHEATPIPPEARYAGVSAFGFGGSNAHVILERPEALATAQQRASEAEKTYLIPLSARSPQSLRGQCQRLAHFLADLPPQSEQPFSLNELASQLALGRSALPYRRCFVAKDWRSFKHSLLQAAQEEPQAPSAKLSSSKILFVFAGMGGSDTAASARLLLQVPPIQARFVEIEAFFEPHLGLLLSHKLAQPQAVWEDQAEMQALIFALQLSLLAYWEAQGVSPQAVLGSSMGEIAAACAAGLLSVAKAAELLIQRVRLLQSQVGQGALAVVGQGAEQLKSELQAQGTEVWVAGENGPRLSVVAGRQEALQSCLKHWSEQGLFVRLIPGATAPSHTPLMAPLKGALLRLSQQSTTAAAPETETTRAQFWSSVSVSPLNELPADYWWQNVRSPVRLFPCLQAIHQQGHWIVLECSPQAMLSPSLDGVALETQQLRCIAGGLSKQPQAEQQADVAHHSLLQSLAALYEAGFNLDWTRHYELKRVLSLPTYSWDLQDYWLPRSQYTQRDQPPPKQQTPPSLPGAQKAEASDSEGQEAASPPLSEREQLRALPPEKQQAFLVARLRSELALAIHEPPESLDVQRPLKHLGIGSLVGMELYNRVRKLLDVKLPMSDILRGPSLEELAHLLLEQLRQSEPEYSAPRLSTHSPQAERHPLSPAQTRFWFLDQLQGGLSHHIPVCLKLTGPLDAERLQEAFAALVQRHSLLRHVYRQEQSQLYQMPIDAPLQWALRSEPFSLEALLAQARRPFDLEQLPPFRVTLWWDAAEQQNHYLLVDMHHILADGYSFGILFQDLQKLYAQPSQLLPPVTAEFVDFARHCQDAHNSTTHQHALSEWREILAELPFKLELPSDYPRPAQLQTQGARYLFVVPVELRQTLEAQSRAQGVSVFSLMMAAFQLMLARWSGQQDFVVGTPVLGRDALEWQEIVGPFLNLLPLRASITEAQDTHSLSQAVQERLLQAMDRAVPFENLIETLNPERDPAWTPLIQVVMALHAAVELSALQAPQQPDLQVEHWEFDLGISRFDLALTLHPGAQDFQAQIEYRSSLFCPETIAALSQAWLCLLEQFCQPQALPLEQLSLQQPAWAPLLSGPDPDPRMHPRDTSTAQNPAPRLLDQIQSHVEHSGQAIALEGANGERWSYAQLWQSACVLAAEIQAAQGEPSLGRPVAVALPPGPEMVVAWLACRQAGLPYVPLSHQDSPERLASICRDLKVSLVLSPPERGREDWIPWELRIAPGAAPIPLQSIGCFQLPPFSRDRERSTQAVDLAYLVMTSGSTGKPKAVAIGESSLYHLVQWHCSYHGLTAEGRCAQWASPVFDAAAWEIWPTLYAGARLLFTPEPVRRDPQALRHWLNDKRITQVFIATPVLLHCFQSWERPPAGLRILTGGAALTQALPRSWLPTEDSPHAGVYNHYGPSENTVVTTVCQLSAAPTALENTVPEPPPIGRPLPGQRLYVLDSQGQPLPAGLSGELAIGGVGLADGYWLAPQLTRKAFVQAPPERLYRSGDRVSVRRGQVYFLGRCDRQIKVRGVRLEPGEIEAQLREHPEIEQAYVSLHQGRLIAWVQSPSHAVQAQSCLAWLRQRLPQSHWPEHIVCLTQFPLTARGKLDEAALKRLLTPAEPSLMQPSIPTSSQLSDSETRLLKIWQRLLPHAVLDRNSSFFASGGHSLMALELRQAVEAEFGLEMPLTALFQSDKLSQLASWLDQAPADLSHLPRLTPEPDHWGQPFELTPVQQAYWIGRQEIQGGGRAAQAYLELRYEALDIPSLERALRHLIQGHPMLRMVMTAQGQQQVLSTAPPWRPQHHDWKNLGGQEQDRRLQALRQELQLRPGDPQHWPLFDVHILEYADHIRLCLKLDALMADASSLQILARDLERLYRGDISHIPEQSLRFQDWVRYIHSLRTHPRYQRDREWWLERLNTLPPPPQLPRRQNVHSSTQSKRLSGRLNAPQWAQLQARAAQLGVTPTALLLSLFVSVLGRWTERQAMTLNLTTFQRPAVHPELNDVVGDFTRLSLLSVTPQQDFEAQTRALQHELLEVLDHALFSGLEVMRALRQHIAAGHSSPAPADALFPVVFTSALGHGELQWPLAGQLETMQTQTPQVWLDHQVMQVDGELLYHWDYPEGLFDGGLMPQIFQAWEDGLRALFQAQHSASWVHWPEPAAAALTHPDNPQRALHLPCLQQALKSPERLAVITPTERVSYAALSAAAWQLSQQLRPWLEAEQRTESDSGTPPLIALYLRGGWQQTVSVLATLMAGAAYLPLSLDWPAQRIASLLQHTQAVGVLHDVPEQERATHPVLQALQTFSTPHHYLTPELLQAPPAAQDIQAYMASAQHTPPPKLAYVIFTSGSTGEPKGVMLSHQAAWNTVEAVNRELQVQPQDRVFALSALSFDLSVYDIFGPLSRGAALVYPDPQARREPAHWLACCQQEQVSLWNSVPALMDMLRLYAAGRPSASALLPSLRAVLLSGDWLPLALPEQIHRHLSAQAQVYSLGGATEGAIWSIWYPIQDVQADWPSIPYGQAMPGQAVYVLDPWLSQCPPGVNGEIYLAGHGVAEGYWGNAELSQSRFFRHPQTGERLYRTGDHGRYDAAGLIWFLGRQDHQVKVGGYRIELGEIEAAAQRHPQVTQAVALAPGQREARSLVLCWQGEAHEAELRAHLAQLLPTYMLPQLFQWRAPWPLNATGKVDRKALLVRCIEQFPQLARHAPESQQQLAPPAHRAEAPPKLSSSEPEAQASSSPPWIDALRQVIAETLQWSDAEIQLLTDERDLLALGIHSLDMVRLGNAFEQRWGHAPGMGELLRLRTLRALAEYYAEHSAEKPKPGAATTTLNSTPTGQSSARTPRPDPTHALVNLPVVQGESSSQSSTWRSQREFSPEPIRLEQLSRVLSCLQRRPSSAPHSSPRAAYASASALYAVEIYLHLRQNGELSAGLWQYDPVTHTLKQLKHLELWPYPGVLQQAWSAEAQMGLYLIADLPRIQRQYGRDSRDYALLEAGAMAQVLRQQASSAELGLCGLGQNDIRALRPLFGEPPAAEAWLFSLLGGCLPQDSGPEADSPDALEWEEFVI